MLGDEAAEAAEEAGNPNAGADLEAITSKIPQGMSLSSPKAQAALRDIKGDPAYILSSALGGAGMGAAAAQGSINPIASFTQGFAAGLSAPSKVYEMKKAQLQSTLDASPLSAVLPELAERYPVFAGMPAGVALPAIQQIMNDANKIQQAGAIEFAKAKGKRAAEIVGKDSAIGHAERYKQITGHDINASVFENLTNSEAESYLSNIEAKNQKSYSDSQSLAADLNRRLDSRNIPQIRDSFSSIKRYVESGNIDPFADKTMLIEFVKMYSPNARINQSGDLEGDTASIPKQLLQEIGSYLRKTKLDPEDRTSILKAASNKFEQAKRDYIGITNRAAEIARRNNLEVADIMPEGNFLDVGEPFTKVDPNAIPAKKPGKVVFNNFPQ